MKHNFFFLRNRMTTSIYLAVFMCMSLSLISCDKLKDATSKDFKVNNVSFKFIAESKAGATTTSIGALSTRAAATQSFTVTRTIDISELGSDDVVKYANKIDAVRINNSLVQVTVNPAGTYTVENLTVTASGVSGSIVIPTYTTGASFTLTSDMNTFTSAFIMKLVSAKTVSVTVTGMTDAPVGTTLNISYDSDLLFTASIF